MISSIPLEARRAPKVLGSWLPSEYKGNRCDTVRIGFILIEKVFMPTTTASRSRGPGRPRSEKARKAVLRSTLAVLRRVGFNELTIESVAGHAGVGKATIYRWWPNKAELVIDVFVSLVGQELRFPSTGKVLQSIHAQMKRWVVIFRSPIGQIVRAMIGAGQSDPEILEAFRSHWVEPRRIEARKLLKQAAKQGEIRADLAPDMILDLLYGPLYLRLLLEHAPLDEDFVDKVFAVVSPTLISASAPV